MTATTDADAGAPGGAPAEGDALADEILAEVSDYLDGALPAARRAEVEARIASDPAWRRAHDELRETRDALSGLQRARAPGTFDQGVTSTIHRRSAGRFFGRRTFGDRVPFGLLLALALALVLPIAYVLWSSSTGSLKRDPEPPAEPRGSQQPLIPAP